jgi:hypothetical protein
LVSHTGASWLTGSLLCECLQVAQSCVAIQEALARYALWNGEPAESEAVLLEDVIQSCHKMWALYTKLPPEHELHLFPLANEETRDIFRACIIATARAERSLLHITLGGGPLLTEADQLGMPVPGQGAVGAAAAAAAAAAARAKAFGCAILAGPIASGKTNMLRGACVASCGVLAAPQGG